MQKVILEHNNFWSDRKNVYSTLVGIFFFSVSLVISYFASIFAFNHQSNAVADIILDNIPVIRVDDIFIEGAILFVIFVLLLLLKEPKKIPFVTKSIALFISIRSFFVILTHIGPSPMSETLDWGTSLHLFTSGGDLFFSGHTGLPFLLALIFWENKILRNIFISASIIAGTAVLFGHLHYSIDVFAAYFITYTIYHICLKVFAKDHISFKTTH